MVKPVKTFKLALGIEYDGSSYYGWQSQKKLDSIEEKLIYALSTIANHKVNVFCAGRTDAGVHSTGQVVHFKTTSQRSSEAWTLGTNANLPNDISVRWVKIVSSEFHARFSAIARRYCYIIYNHRLRPAILSKGLTHVHHQLNVEKMQYAGQYLLGENDFTSFRSAHCQSRTPWRNIIHFNVIYQNPYIIFDIKANSFVRHMVRNIIGTLIEIGSSNKPAEWIIDVLNKKDRSQAAATAKAEGLYLIEVEYPCYFLLPTSVKGPVFIHGIIN